MDIPSTKPVYHGKVTHDHANTRHFSSVIPNVDRIMTAARSCNNLAIIGYITYQIIHCWQWAGLFLAYNACIMIPG